MESLAAKDGDFLKEVAIVEALEALAILAQRCTSPADQSEVYLNIRGPLVSRVLVASQI